MLVCLLHAPRGPFYSPKAARSRWRPIKEGQTCLMSGGAPDSPVHHRTTTVACPVLISFLLWHRRPLQPWASWRTGQSSAHCRPLELPRVARGLRGRPLAHQTVRWIIVVRCQTFPRAACSWETSLAHRTLSGAPPDSPVCQAKLDFGCTQPSLLQFFSFLLFSVSNT
jgi:hypothetical protein